MAPFVYIGTILTHLFGGSAGREGTALQMAGSFADQLSKPLKLNHEDRSTLIISAVAGGFGAVFGTPLAGAIFALEFFLIGRLRYNALFPALLTAVLSDQITKLWDAHHTHYQIHFVPELTFQGILYALLAGGLFALCAAAFSKGMQWMSALWKSKIKFSPLQTFVGGLLVISAVYLLGTSKYIGLGIPTIVSSFDQQLPTYDFALKMIFTVVTLSAGFKGGEVTPLFFIGATLGNALSLFIPLPMGLLAGMGFVAVFAGATNTPIACTLMAIELFGADCAVYVAIACFTSYLFSGNTSIYRRQIVGEPKNPAQQDIVGKRLNEL
jgi:H+/Cl- antiporter ClcA